MHTTEEEYLGLGCNWFKRSLRLIAMVILSLVGLLGTSGNAQCLPPISIHPDALPDGALGVSYSQTFTHQGGGYSEVSWHIPYGAVLPPGLTLNHDTGVLSGTPTAAGTYYFFVRATSTFNGWCYGERRYGIAVKGPTTTILAVSNDPATAGQTLTLTAQVSAAGGGTPTGTVQFAVNGSPVGSAVPVVGGTASLNITAPAGDGSGYFAASASYSGGENSWPSSHSLTIMSFDYSVRDDATGDQLFFNSNGTYLFIHDSIASSLALKGKGVFTSSHCTVFLEHFKGDRYVTAEVNSCDHTGTATVIYQGVTYTITQGGR